MKLVGQDDGIVCFNFDSGVDKRIYIHHLTTKDKTKFPEILKQVASYFWQKFNIDTIRLNLFHFVPKGSENL